MPTLYVDVDGTLAFGEKTNFPLVDAVAQFIHEHPDWELVVWSHAGQGHAQHWAERCFRTGLNAVSFDVEEKDFTKVNGDDVVVDNMHLPFGMLPQTFVRDVRSGKVKLPEADVGLPAGAEAQHGDLSYWNQQMGARR
jgi:hypothetical protein